MADTTIKYVSSQNLSYYDTKNKKYITDADAALKATLEGQIEVVAGALDSEIARAKGEEAKNATAASNAQAKGEEALAHSEALAEKVGEVPENKTVMGYIDEKTANIASEGTVNALAERVTQAETDIDNIEKDYLKASDKQELEGKINLKADQTALDEVSEVANAAATKTALQGEENRAKGEEGRIEGLVTAEAERATEIEEGLRKDVDAIKGDYLKAADKTELQGKIDKNTNAIELLTNGVSAEEVDGVNDLIQYVKDHGTEVTGIKADIKANADAIDEIEEKVGEKTVHAQITEAIAGANLGQYAKDADLTAAKDRIAELEAIDHEAYVAADTTLKNELTGEIAKDRTRLDALELIDHEHANKALLDTYTQTEANLADAVAKKHPHENKTVLDGITAKKVTAWDASEQNAKNHADGLNSAMATRVDGIVETVATKATQADLTALITRVGAEETKSTNFETRIATNEEFISNLTFMSESDIDSMFV